MSNDDDMESRWSPGERVLRDPAVWAEMWYEARDALSRGEVPAFTRWHADAPFCA